MKKLYSIVKVIKKVIEGSEEIDSCVLVVLEVGEFMLFMEFDQIVFLLRVKLGNYYWWKGEKVYGIIVGVIFGV